MSYNLDFRAWDPQTKKMSYDVTLYANGWSECVYDEGISIKHDPTELYIMQWTGIKDCKRNKIFESDILRVIEDPNSPNEKTYITEVMFIRGCFWLKEVDKQEIPLFYITVPSYSNGYIPLKVEVIGSIYEEKEINK